MNGDDDCALGLDSSPLVLALGKSPALAREFTRCWTRVGCDSAPVIIQFCVEVTSTDGSETFFTFNCIQCVRIRSH